MNEMNESFYVVKNFGDPDISPSSLYTRFIDEKHHGYGIGVEVNLENEIIRFDTNIKIKEIEKSNFIGYSEYKRISISDIPEKILLILKRGYIKL